MGSDGKTAHQYHLVSPTLLGDPPEPSDPLDPADALGSPAFSQSQAPAPDATGVVAAEEIGVSAPPAGAPDPAGGADTQAPMPSVPPDGIDDTVMATADPAPPSPPDSTPPVESPADAEAAGQDALTPIPDTIPAGDPLGVPLLVGGADLDDSQATLLAYDSPQGPREMLVATVTPEAEAKLLDALSPPRMVEVQVEEEVHGRLAADTDGQIYEQLATVAKSVNHHAGLGDDIPAHTHANFATVAAQLDALTETGVDGADAQMLEHYRDHAQALKASLDNGGGKVPFVTPFEQTSSTLVTRLVPDPDSDAGPTASVRPATRIAPTLDDEGVARWNGHDRNTASEGQEYAIDLGDGYTAVYRPHGAVGDLTQVPALSQRGTLEIAAPAGPGHAADLVDKLGDLHLVNRPMTAPEGEWSYLRRQVWAQDLEGNPAISQALHAARDLDDATEHVLFAERAHQAMGLDERGLQTFARSLRLEAEAQALPTKVTLLRDAVASVTGHASGAALAASPGYDPRPHHTGRGWLRWNRFDVAGDPAAVRGAFGNRGLQHTVGNGDLHTILHSGVLASTERRALMGVAAGIGSSETSDQNSGGATSVFLRVRDAPIHGPALYWSDPSVLLRRADVYAYPDDNYGATVRKAGYTRNPLEMATFSTGLNNEVMIRNGIDLLGAEAPSLIRCSGPGERAEILALFKEKKIEKLGGRTVDEVVVY
ncbi:hypothetical protein [Parafrankia discariae]|uniref:hypothetical protein n=1 Tax=Parafrankia discariae TaxID=365528 RepID=UPI00035F338C|nr:hypothetical protein [Parafrankia discariae]